MKDEYRLREPMTKCRSREPKAQSSYRLRNPKKKDEFRPGELMKKTFTDLESQDQNSYLTIRRRTVVEVRMETK